MTAWRVTAFYKFTDLEDPAAIKIQLEAAGRDHGLLGTILLAPEGINSTIAGPPDGLDAFMAFLRFLNPFRDLDEKRSWAATPPFHRFKVRLKKEIVTLGDPETDPRKAVGTYVDPADWNDLVKDPDTVLIDTRNDYEVDIGRFEGAINPHTRSFREFPDWVQANLDPQSGKKIAMYCTGGIRCEKATSLLRRMGFEQVFHLKGGILKYLETVPVSESSWKGSCFVFDGRVGVSNGLKEDDYELCHGCRHPLSPEDRKDPLFEEGVCCPQCADRLTLEQKERFRERHRQVELARQRGEQHIGFTPGSPPDEHAPE